MESEIYRNELILRLPFDSGDKSVLVIGEGEDRVDLQFKLMDNQRSIQVKIVAPNHIKVDRLSVRKEKGFY